MHKPRLASAKTRTNEMNENIEGIAIKNVKLNKEFLPEGIKKKGRGRTDASLVLIPW